MTLPGSICLPNNPCEISRLVQMPILLQKDEKTLRCFTLFTRWYFGLDDFGLDDFDLKSILVFAFFLACLPGFVWGGNLPYSNEGALCHLY